MRFGKLNMSQATLLLLILACTCGVLAIMEPLAVVRFRQQSSRKCAGIVGNNQEKLNDGANLWIWDCGEPFNQYPFQKWEIAYVKTNSGWNFNAGFYKIRNTMSDRCMTAAGTERGSMIQQYPCDVDNVRQRWYPIGDTSSPQGSQRWTNGRSYLCLSSESGNNGAHLVLDSCGGGSKAIEWQTQTCQNFNFIQM